MTALEIVQKTVRERLPEGGFAIDATAGRGHDTVFLARTVGKSGRVLAFDIQQAAVDSTRALLEKEGLAAEVVLASHADMASYAEPESADCILFNLGWLPGSDKSVATRPSTTVAAIRAAVELMDKSRGFLSVAAYRAHPGGREEFEAVGELFEREIPFGECEISDPADAGSPALFYARFGRGR